MNSLDIAQLLHAQEPEIAKQLGSDIDDAREFALVAFYAISRRPSLLQASRESLAASVLTCARMSLVPGLGLGFFAAERDEKHGLECVFIPTYVGFVDLLERCAELRDVRARLVFERDHFRLHYGAEERLQHRPCKSGDPGPLLAAYAVGRLEDGSERFEVLFRGRDIDPVTPDSDSPPDSARGKSAHDYAEWLKGVAVKRLAKWFTRTPEIAAAVELARATEKSKVRPRAVDVARMLGIDVPDYDAPVTKLNGAHGPSHAEQLAQDVHQEASAVAQDREDHGPWCCACSRSVTEVGGLRVMSVHPQLWSHGACPEHDLGKHKLCVTCTEQHERAELDRVKAEQKRLAVSRSVESARVKKIRRNPVEAAAPTAAVEDVNRSTSSLDSGSGAETHASAPEPSLTISAEGSSGSSEPDPEASAADLAGPTSAGRENTAAAPLSVDPTPTPPYGVETPADWAHK